MQGGLFFITFASLLPLNSIFNTGMKSTEMGIELSSKAFTKFFELDFNIPKVAFQLKRSTKEIETKIKQQLKNLLIGLEGDLLRSKRIKSSNTVFMNITNPEIQKKLIQIDRILDEKSVKCLLSYYKSRFNEFNIHMPHHLQTVYPISLDSRIAIYRQFVEYVESLSLSTRQAKGHCETIADLVRKGFKENKYDVYQEKDLEFLWAVYEKNQGNVDEIYEELQSRGLNDAKYQRSTLEFKLANLKLIGLYQVYSLTSTWMEGKILRWNKFIKCYGDIFMDWPAEDQKKLLRIAVSDNTEIEDIKHITLKMGSMSAQRQPWTIDYVNRALIMELTRPKKESRQPRESYQIAAQQISESIKDEIKRKLAGRGMQN